MLRPGSNYVHVHVLFLGICNALLLSPGFMHFSSVFAQPTAGQFKGYKEQYGRFSIPVPKDWNIDSPSIRQNSVAESFEPKNGDDFLLTIVARDRHSIVGQNEFEQIIRDENTALLSELPGATLIQDTDCTKYVIDGNKACSVIFSVTRNQYTQKEMDLDFQSAKQAVSISLTGSNQGFQYLPIVNHMLNSMTVS